MATRMNEAKICQACPSQNTYNAGMESETDGYEVRSTFLCAVMEKIWESAIQSLQDGHKNE